MPRVAEDDPWWRLDPEDTHRKTHIEMALFGPAIPW
jgi:hypothetical protein